MILEAVLIDASSRVLLADAEPWLRLYRRLVLTPLPRRRPLLAEWMAMGWVPLPQEWDLFGPDDTARPRSGFLGGRAGLTPIRWWQEACSRCRRRRD